MHGGDAQCVLCMSSSDDADLSVGEQNRTLNETFLICTVKGMWRLAQLVI